jgi:hypothetical protein
VTWSAACTALAAALIGCGDDAAPGPPPELRDDARLLAEVLADDDTPQALVEVDDAILDRLPVRAAELLESGAIPAARRVAERVEAAEVRTVEGRQVRSRVLSASRARVEALEAYRDALRRGDVEDLRLAATLRAQREAESALADATVEVEALIAE